MLVLSFSVPGRLKIGEFDHVGDGYRAPIRRHAMSFVVSNILRGDNRAAVANDNHPRIKDVVGGVIYEPYPKWPETLVIEFANYIMVRHSQLF